MYLYTHNFYYDTFTDISINFNVSINKEIVKTKLRTEKFLKNFVDARVEFKILNFLIPK